MALLFSLILSRELLVFERLPDRYGVNSGHEMLCYKMRLRPEMLVFRGVLLKTFQLTCQEKSELKHQNLYINQPALCKNKKQIYTKVKGKM